MFLAQIRSSLVQCGRRTNINETATDCDLMKDTNAHTETE